MGAVIALWIVGAVLVVIWVLVRYAAWERKRLQAMRDRVRLNAQARGMRPGERFAPGVRLHLVPPPEHIVVPKSKTKPRTAYERRAGLPKGEDGFGRAK